MDEALTSVNPLGCPMALLHGTPPPSVALPSVTGENIEATTKLVEHLIRVHNRRRILFLRGPIHQEDSARREAGYKSALESNDIPVDENLILHGEFEREVAFQTM